MPVTLGFFMKGRFFSQRKKGVLGTYLCCYPLSKQPHSKCSLPSSPAGDMPQVTGLKHRGFCLVLRDT